MEDLADYLLHVSRMYPHLLVGQRLEDLMQFLLIFLSSPAYVKNPYIRAKLSEVIHAWLPEKERPLGASGRWGSVLGQGFRSAHCPGAARAAFVASPCASVSPVATYSAKDFSERHLLSVLHMAPCCTEGVDCRHTARMQLTKPHS